MTAARRLRTRDLALAALGAGALVLVTACGSATDLATDEDSTSVTSPEDPPLRTLPPTTGTPAPSATPSTPAVVLPKIGECRKPGPVDAALRVSDDDVAPVSCSGATSVTYLVRSMPTAVRSAVTAYDTTRILGSARGICEKAVIAHLGADQSTFKRSQFDFIVGVPSAAQTAAGAGWMRCDLVLPASPTRLAAVPGKTKGALKGRASSRYMQCVRGDIRVATGTVPCTTKHQWRGVDSVKLGAPKAKYPGAKKVQATMRDRCPAGVRRYLDTRGSFDYGYISPSRTAWQRGERWGVCFAKTRK
ncbi:septum formation family protein [Mumia sp. zg.B17]|uniref:septum formation family protein n=1 Tax=unclassified Mumia TaxID=2621872 RepID=UPI001C6EE72F|nr:MULTISPECIES: septum formation family protein [unclassified Mumia]MBW9206431.1 septum formation family protein [Mumia sp. zg.B17]MDD9349789.1 septum formation family protein [Mumia sp.]